MPLLPLYKKPAQHAIATGEQCWIYPNKDVGAQAAHRRRTDLQVYQHPALRPREAVVKEDHSTIMQARRKGGPGRLHITCHQW